MWVGFAIELCQQTSTESMCTPLTGYRIRVGTHSRSAAKWLSRLMAGEAFCADSNVRAPSLSIKYVAILVHHCRCLCIVWTIVCLDWYGKTWGPLLTVQDNFLAGGSSSEKARGEKPKLSCFMFLPFEEKEVGGLKKDR
jgi:hypothetical protein